VKRLHQTALIAWNTALFPKPERQRQLEQLIAALKIDAHSLADMKAIVAELVERKDRFFAQYKRAILDFELTEAGKDYHLSVVSSAEPVEPAA